MVPAPRLLAAAALACAGALEVPRRRVLAGAPSLAAPLLAPGAAVAGPLRGAYAFPEMGIGAWAWGDSLFWGYDPRKDDELREVFDFVAARKDGFVDTAELYGIGRSESLIAQFERGGGSVKVASKFAALPWRTKRGDVVKACRASLKRLEADSMDLYQIHFPNAWANEAYWDGLADCFDLGLVKSVGVSNYGSDAVRAVASTLEARGIALASNQIQYSLVYPFANANGLKRTCDDLGVTVLAYSPLGLGLLSGKYGRDRLPSGPRAKLGEAFFAQPAADELLDAVRRVQGKHAGATSTQVAINWCRAKGAVPIPGCRTLAQVTQNYDALGWKMDGADVALLDAAANKLKPPGSAGFPEKDINTGMRMFDS